MKWKSIGILAGLIEDILAKISYEIGKSASGISESGNWTLPLFARSGQTMGNTKQDREDLPAMRLRCGQIVPWLLEE